jgi:hypothetical protein
LLLHSQESANVELSGLFVLLLALLRHPKHLLGVSASSPIRGGAVSRHERCADIDPRLIFIFDIKKQTSRRGLFVGFKML